jgi:hypothetical protein
MELKLALEWTVLCTSPTAAMAYHEAHPYWITSSDSCFKHPDVSTHLPSSQNFTSTRRTNQHFQTSLLINPKEHSPSIEAISSTSQEITRILCNPNAHHRVHKSPTLFPYPGPHQFNPRPRNRLTHTHFIIILPSMPRSSTWSPSLRFPHQNPLPVRATYPTHLIPFFLIWVLEWRLVMSTEHDAPHCAVTRLP